MRFTFALVVVISALTFIVSAQTSSTTSNGPQNPISYPLGGTMKSGGSITITWDPTYGDSIDLILRQGEDTNLDTVETIASGIPNSGSFLWSIPKDLAAGNDYSIEIISGTETNYSPLFGIDSTTISSTTSSSTTSSSTTSSPPSSSSSSSSLTSSETSSSMSISSTSPATSTATTAFSSGSSNLTFTTSHTRTSSSTATGTTAPGGNQATSVNAGSHHAIPFSFIFSILFGFIAGLVYLY